MLAFALIAAMPLTTCKLEPDTGKKSDPRVLLVDVSEETDWDYLLIAKDGSSAFYNVDETGIPTSLFFKPDKNSDNGFTILFKENGLPDRMVSNGFILVYGNFRGYQYDLAVIKPDNTIEYHYDIQTDVNWDAYNARALSGQGRAAKKDVDTLDLIGHTVGVMTCVSAVFFPPSVVGCVSYLVSEAGNLVIDGLVDAKVIDKATGEWLHILIDSLGCLTGDPIDCIQYLSGVVTQLFSGDTSLLLQKNIEINEVIRVIEGGGMTWNVLNTSASWKAIAYGGDTFAIGSRDGEMAYSTNYGSSWTGVGKSPFKVLNFTDSVNDMAYGNGKFVAVGDSGKMAYSDDGISWALGADTANTPLNGEISAVSYGNGRFVAGSRRGQIAYSDDGMHWTLVSDRPYGSATDSKIYSMAYGNGKFVAGGYDGSNLSNKSDKVAYSTDGIHWTVSTTQFSLPNTSIAYGNGVFVFAGSYGRMAYSTDGIHWTEVTVDGLFSLDLQQDISAIAYGGGRFVIGTQYGALAYSRDGKNWTRLSDAESISYESIIRGIAYGNGRFVAVGESKVMYSNWSSGGKGGDAAAPELSSGSANRTGHTQAIIGFSSSEAGMAYYSVLEVGAYFVVPANTAVRNGGMPLGAVTAGANSGMKAVTLTAGAKNIYVVVQDAGGNISEPLEIEAEAYSGGGGNIPGGGSGLTINNLPSGGDYSFFVFVFDSGTDISTYQAVSSALNSEIYQAVGVEPSGGVFSLVTPYEEETWTGTGAFPVLLYNENGTTEEGDGNPMFRRATVNFTNGTGAANFSSFTAVVN